MMQKNLVHKRLHGCTWGPSGLLAPALEAACGVAARGRGGILARLKVIVQIVSPSACCSCVSTGKFNTPNLVARPSQEWSLFKARSQKQTLNCCFAMRELSAGVPWYSPTTTATCCAGNSRVPKIRG